MMLSIKSLQGIYLGVIRDAEINMGDVILISYTLDYDRFTLPYFTKAL